MTGDRSDTGCVFCAARDQGVAHPLVIWAGAEALVILNKYPYNNGHVMVVPHRHVASLSALGLPALQEVALLTQRTEAVLMAAYRPQGINVGVNIGKAAGAGIDDHLHVHLVPRWTGDTNFITTIGETRVLPEVLDDAAVRLRPIFASVMASG
ncbi:MAG: HIT domain-containing protein [Vicinamibacterales bacterium]